MYFIFGHEEWNNDNGTSRKKLKNLWIYAILTITLNSCRELSGPFSITYAIVN